MILGSHNTMTFLSPKKWWQWFGLPIARCQTKNIQQQYEAGVRCFDIRVNYEKSELGNQASIEQYAHGLVEFSSLPFGRCSPRAFAAWASNKAAVDGTIYLRLTLETSEPDAVVEKAFSALCADLDKLPNIKCFNGRRKFDWKEIYRFNYSPKLYQLCGSMQSNYGKVFPFLWHLLNQKKIAALLNDSTFTNKYDIILTDFI